MEDATSVKLGTVRQILKSKTIKELIHNIPSTAVERMCLILLILLCVAPLIVPITYEHGVNGEMLGLGYSNDWYYRIMPFGLLGLVVLLYNVARSLCRKCEAQESMKQWARRRMLVLCLSMMLLFSLLSTFIAGDPVLSVRGDQYRMEGLVTYFLYAGYFAIAMNIKTFKSVRRLLEAFAGTAAAIAVLGILDIPTVNNLLGMSPDRGSFFNANHYGYYAAMALMAGMALLLTDQRKHRHAWRNATGRVLRILEIGLLAHALRVCVAMGALVAVGCGLTALLILIWVKDRHMILRLLAADGMVILVYCFLNTSSHDMSVDYLAFATDVTEIVEGTNLDTIGSGRGILWKNAISFIGERPLLGYGPDNLAAAYAARGVAMDRPHNEILQFAASLGIPAAICYLGGMYAHLHGFIRRFRKLSLLTIGLYAVVGTYLISSLFGNTMFYTTPYFFMFLGLSYGQLWKTE